MLAQMLPLEVLQPWQTPACWHAWKRDVLALSTCRKRCWGWVNNMRAVLWVGGIVIFGVIIFMVVPGLNVQESGSATLVQVSSTNVLGTATLSPTQRGQATLIDVQVQHLVPMSNYALSIHAGSCYGALLTALQPAITDSTGSGSSSTVLSAQIQSTWFIVLHTGSSTRDDVLACGQVIISPVVTNPTPNPYETPIIYPTMPGQFPNTGGGPPQQP
jgi:hypothetical protein